MAQFAILGDTHWGCRNDLIIFHKHFETFYSRMFDELEEAGITTIVQLGDLFDRRKYINFKTLSEAKRIFFDQLRDRGMKLIMLLGNHDIHHRESLSINSPMLMLNEYDNIYICNNPTSLNIHGVKVDMVPWICKENQEEVNQFLVKSKSELCFGHFEIKGFSMYRGMEAHDGLPVSLFEKYELVCTGHYHTRSQRDNVVYVGTPYEMTWHDHDDPKGYHIFDTETRALTFVRNPIPIFIKLIYDDTNELPNLDDMDLEDKFVKVIVVNKTNMFAFDNFVQKLYTKKCFEIKLVEDLSEFGDGELGEEIELENTIDVLSDYVDSLDSIEDKQKVKTFLKSLYVEAVNQEVV